MKRLQFVFAAILALVLPYTTIGSESNKPVKSTTPLSADEIAIYKAVLRTYSEEKDSRDASLNVSARTYPLDPSAHTNGFDQPECLDGVQLDTVSHSYHELSAEVLPSKTMKIVDPKKQEKVVRSNDPSNTIRKGKPVKEAVEAAFTTALFSMSEIAFDKDHRFAAVTYRFWCGSLCGHGSTLVFKKVNGEWQKLRNCGGWVS